MPKGALRFVPATEDVAESLADLRAAAMKPSLVALGRYDAQRVRARLLDGFSAQDTTLVMDGERLAAFFVLQTRSDHLYLDHLYVHPDWQGHGIGSFMMDEVMQRSTKQALPIRLMALKESPANAFYQGFGFRQTSETAYDTHYERSPA